ncbi:MAG: SRPBCC family protein [Polyangiaceae bacterium]
MYDFEEERTTHASIEDVWAVYVNVAGWPAWHGGLDAAQLDGPFESGIGGAITVSVGISQDVPFHLENVVPLKSFDVVWKLGPLVKTTMTHTLEKTSAGTLFKHAYHTGGVMAPFSFFQAALAHDRAPGELERLARLAEARSH